MNTPALVLENVTKRYKNEFQALSGVNLTIDEGDFFALLGANGAGKTTTINIISGLLPKTSGSVSAFGFAQETHPNEVKHLIGLMPQEFNFNSFTPVVEILTNQAGYYGISRTEALPRAEKLLRKMELWEKRNQMAKTLSGGMKRRLMLARALIHRPKILILDEPTAGVDVEIRISLWKFLRELNAEGTTIILTTHYLEEAEKLCKNIAIIDKGKVITHTSMAELLTQVESRTLSLTLAHPLDERVKLDAHYHKIDTTHLQVSLTKEQNISEVVQYLADNNIIVQDIVNSENRLENLFLNLTKK